MIDGRWRSALIEVKTPTVSWPSLAALVLNEIDLCNKWNIKLFVHKLSLDSLSRGQLSSIRATAARGKAICNDLQWPAMAQGVPTSPLLDRSLQVCWKRSRYAARILWWCLAIRQCALVSFSS